MGIVDVTYNKVGRRLSQRDPRGYLTTYSYDLLDRRTNLTNPLSMAWDMLYTKTGASVILNDPLNHHTERLFDRAGRLTTINYLSEAPKLTPNVTFTYDKSGNCLSMAENNGSPVRATSYVYDDVRRLTQANFDTDGDGDIDHSVSYEYDAGGLRTKMTMPGGLEIEYTYDQRGRLLSMTDWDDQTTNYKYDTAGRLIESKRVQDKVHAKIALVPNFTKRQGKMTIHS